MNLKPAHMKNDSNKYRQKKNEEQKIQMKKQFTKVDLMNIPSDVVLVNENIYKSLVENLEELGLGVHLKNIDIRSLVALANSYHTLNEIEKSLKKYGTYQVVETRDKYTKIVSTPFLQQKNTLINSIQTQMQRLQLDPQSRQLLSEAILNDINMVDDSFDENDDLFQTIIKRMN